MTVPAQRPHQSKQDYSTPSDFIAAVKRRLQIPAFHYDLAADADNAKATRYYTEADDSLSQAWPHDPAVWNWLNPPFSNITPWAQRCAQESLEGCRTAFLVPASVGANWYRHWVEPYAYTLFLNGRLAFMPDKPTWLYPKDCMVCLFTPEGLTGSKVWDWRQE